MVSEAKKLALLRIKEILERDTDENHLLTHSQIANLLMSGWGIDVERKAVGRNISLLIEAGYDIITTKRGVYLASRDFEPSEIRLLIDGVLSSRHIGLRHSRDLIEKLAARQNKYFRKNIKHIHSVADFNKTENTEVFYTIDTVHEAIDAGLAVEYDYNKYGEDKRLHRSSFQRVSPYQLILHNQRYYLMAYSEHWGNMVYHRLDRITNIRLSDRRAVPIRDVAGFEGGISYKNLTTAMPYMFSDTPTRVEFLVEKGYIDHVVDWFGKDTRVENAGDRLRVTLTVSPAAMHYWALQFAEAVEVTKPAALRDKIRATLSSAASRYAD